MSQSKGERTTEQPEAKTALIDRELSDAELETVAGAGDDGKGNPNDKPPPPPAGKE